MWIYCNLSNFRNHLGILVPDWMLVSHFSDFCLHLPVYCLIITSQSRGLRLALICNTNIYSSNAMDLRHVYLPYHASRKLNI